MAASNRSQARRRKTAIGWAKRGAAIVPLAPKGKTPIGGYSSRNALKGAEEVAAYFNDNPKANFGICMGGPLGLVVLDVDGEEGRASLAGLVRVHGELPATVTVLTSRGLHCYFVAPGLDVKNSAGRLGAGLDIRGDGGYVVGRGSVHPDGQHYRYKSGCSPAQQEVAQLPRWLAVKIIRTPPPVASPSVAGEGVPEGRRNDVLSSFVGALHRHRLAADVILAAALAENARVCRPPLADAEVAGIVDSVTRYPSGPLDGDIGRHVAQAILDQHYAGGGHLLHAQDGCFWGFNGRLWSPVDSSILRQRALDIATALPRPKPSSDAIMRQALSVLSAQVAISDDRLRFGGDPVPAINCTNGELWLLDSGDVELRPHRAESYLRSGIEIAYDGNAKCPQFRAALKGIFANAKDPAALIRFVFELIGYVIQPDRRIPIIVVFQGAGRNGKSALAETIVRLLGHDLVAAVRIVDLGRSRFSTADLLGKHLLLDDDVSSSIRLPDGDLKRLSEAKLITAERKFGQPFSFTARTMPLLLCNGQPSLADLSVGMQRRLVAVPFKRIFTEEEIDRELFKRIWATELPGILNAALAGWKRIVGRGCRFDFPQDVLIETQAWLRGANPVPEFIEACCSKGGKVLLAELYSAYQTFCGENGITFAQQRSQFKRNLENLGYVCRHSNRGVMIQGISRKGLP